MPIRCPNFRDESARKDFNAILTRLGGVPMTADDIVPRQPYLAKLNEAQERAYFQAHYLFNAHKTPGEIVKFLDALDAVKDALRAEPPAKTPTQPTRGENETGRTPSVPAAEPAAPEPAPLSNLPSIDLARALYDRLRLNKPISAKILQQEAAAAYAGKLSEGRFDRKDMADALELAVNMHIRDTRDLRILGDDWKAPIAKLEDLLSRLPAQRVRSEEQERFQQFSTPPNYAAAAAYAAHLRDGDVILEPSAGTGSLIAAAMRPGVRVIANELSERRAALLRALVGQDGKVFRENAEQLNNTLPDEAKPTVVVMNPPFSQTAGRMGDRKVPMVAPMHIEQALKRLEPGGRLVAIVGRGMTMGQPTYRAWWKKIGSEYSVRANIGVDGKVYEKYGTTFGTRLLVIDKVEPLTAGNPVTGDAQTVEDLMRLLEPIRNARPAAEQHGAEQGSVPPAQRGEGGPAGALSASPEPGGLRTGDRGGGRVAGPGEAGAAEPGGPSVPVEAGEGAGLDVQQPERPVEAGAAGEPAAPLGDRGQRSPGGGARPQRDLEPAGEREPGLTAVGERIELEHAAPGTQGTAEISESLYDAYEPQRVRVPGAKPHPSKLVESAAMASVPPPTPKYKPNLPRAVIEKGLLSNAQLEPVIYAGEAHEKMLPAAEKETAQRKGFFIGDGTGVGKGREIAGIILDNWQQGRTKAVWVSEKRKLLADAKRDWKGLEQNPDHIFNVGKIKNGEAITAAKGIGFITYDTLKGGMSDQAALARGGFVRKQQVSVNGQSGKVARVSKGRQVEITVDLDNGTTVTVPAGQAKALEKAAVKSRVDQLVGWFGANFDGVVAFDEAHNMGNATAEKGERGMKEAAMKAAAGLELQRRLPNARIVYVSATGATEVSNLAYAERLGLWGKGTPFASRNAFISEISQGGIAAMELIATDMKRLGLYTARNLSYDEVEYDRVEHKLDGNQREIYDTLAKAWQVTLRNINKALELTGGDKNGPARNAASSAYWGGNQRFFKQIVTSLQMPSVIKSIEQDLEAGRQVVVQLTMTNEAAQERAAAKAKTAEEIEDLDITPRDQIIQLVEHSFPTQQYEKYVDDDGQVRSRPVMDAEGKPVQNKEAVAMRDDLIERLASVRVPQGPLDLLLDHFGVDVVAEVTGRGRRFVLKADEKTGQQRRIEEKRTQSTNAAEIDTYQQGKKKVLVFSDAGGTGGSYHADLRAPSKDARRVHYVVDGGWRADKALQGLGRTHRSNQASAPIVKLVTTDLQGQKRFVSSIARRLSQLGALTKGQRQAGEQGIFSARDNLESPEAKQALTQFFRDLQRDAVPEINVSDFEAQTGLTLMKKDDEGGVLGALEELPPITQFLNRLLSLEIDTQNKVFDAFSQRLDAVIEARREAGLLDVGLETVKADKIEKATEQTVHTVEGTDAETKYVKLKVSNKFKPTQFDTVASGEWRKVVAWLKSPNGKVYAAAEAPNLTDGSGRIIENYRLISPVSDSRTIARANIEKPDSKWEKIERSEASALWRKEIAAAPEFVTRDMHLVTGAILPIWDRLKGNPRVVRLQTDAGERLIGRVVPNDAIGATLKALGAEGGGGKPVEPKELFDTVLAGGRATLANGWTLSRRLVAGEHRIELVGPQTFSEGQDVKKDGLFTERIDYKVRYFVPSDERGVDVLQRLTQYRPVMELTERGAAPEGLAAGDDAMFSVRQGSGEEIGVVTDRSTASEQKFAELIFPALRRELDKLGLQDVTLNLPGAVSGNIGGRRFELNGYYFRKAITVALNADDRLITLHHEALHALRDLGVFKDSEWGILTQAAKRKWRRDFGIDGAYGHLSEDLKNEEGVAHAYAAWANGEATVDGRIARLFKRIRAFFEALANALRGLGFKTAEDVFRDIRSGEIGDRGKGPGAERFPSFDIKRDEAPSIVPNAEAEPTPNLNRRIRERIEQALSSTAVNKFIEGTQDLSRPIKLLQDELELRRGGAFEDPESFYTRKRLYPGRVGQWTDTFNRKHLDPIVRLLKANDISLNEAGDFLYALHAAERNAEMDKINPGLGGEGSGMGNEEAEKIIAEARRGEHAAALDELRERVGRIRDLILSVMEKGGLEKPEVIAEWKKRYRDYVPLRGWEVEPDDAPPEYRGVGVGFNVRGKEVKQAFGRRSKADNPLVNLFDQAYRTFDRAERNRYLQSLYRALDDLGDEASDIASLDRGKPRREIDKRTGLVRSVESSNQYMNPKAVYLKFDGNPHFMVFRDQEMAEAVKRMSPDSVGVFHSYLMLQNKMKALWTHYSPDFLFRHFVFRYPIEGTLNSFEQKEGGEHRVSQYVKDAFPLVGNASKTIFAANKGAAAETEMARHWEEMRRAGGAMMFRNMRDIDLTREHLETALKDLSDRPLANARAKWRHAVEAMDAVTNALDNSLRLAAYSAARRQGKSVQQAALIAREATVDFQLKGRWNNLMGIFFPFANVAVQTAARMTKAVYRSKIMRRVFGTTVLMGFLTSAFNYLVAGEDKDHIPFFDKIPEWDRRLNFIVLNPFDTDAKGRPQPIKIPMPYNWAFPLLLGYAFGGFVFGKEGPRKLMTMVGKSALQAFTPFGEEENIAALSTPEAFRPLVHLYTNRDWRDRPIHMDETFQKHPNAYSPRKTTGPGWSAIAQGINTATGGSRGKSGLVDLYPEDYREMIDQFAGTQIRLGQNIWDTTAAVAQGKWPEATKMPLERVIRGTDYDTANRARYYELRDRQKHPWRH
jgi:predicted RNA methylase